MKIENANAVVTGAGSGIGRGIAHALAARGAGVVVADVQRDAAEAVAGQLSDAGARAAAYGCDVSQEAQVAELADYAWDAFGSIDMVFNNAGVAAPERSLSTGLDDMRWMFEVNVFGVWHGCRVFGRRFLKQDTQTWICNTGSEHSLGVPALGQPLYGATKHAVLGLSDVIRRELPDRVGVSVFCPGIVSTSGWSAGRIRPERFGGPIELPEWSKGAMSKGLDPLDVGQAVVSGVEAEEFFIVTHPHDFLVAQERFDELRGAFERQAPVVPGTDRDATANAIKEAMAELH